MRHPVLEDLHTAGWGRQLCPDWVLEFVISGDTFATFDWQQHIGSLFCWPPPRAHCASTAPLFDLANSLRSAVILVQV